MLLNQCLAISLSPVALKDAHKIILGRCGELESEEKADTKCDGNNRAAAVVTTTSFSGLKRTQLSEVSLFQQLIKQNSQSKTINCKEIYSEKTIENDSEDRRRRDRIEKGEEDENVAPYLIKRKQSLLEDALSRVDFAGFVVPSWLLLSGTYNDLHFIKMSWSEGNLRPPLGFKIETIGKWTQKHKFNNVFP